MSRDPFVVRDYFWPYDVFGYFLPGLVGVLAYSEGNRAIGSIMDRLWITGRLLDIVVLAAAVYISGHIIAALSSWFLEKQILRGVLKYPTTRLFSTTPVDTTSLRARLGNVLFPGYLTQYSTEFQARFRQLFRETFSLEPSDPRDCFHLCWSYVCLFHAPAYHRASHFIDLYGFARNLSMCFVLIFPAPFVRGWTGILPTWLWCVTCLFVALTMFVNYAKLLKRLDDETYRGFVSHASTRKHSDAGR